MACHLYPINSFEASKGNYNIIVIIVNIIVVVSVFIVVVVIISPNVVVTSFSDVVTLCDRELVISFDVDSAVKGIFD